jgi:hypothetical protein
MRNARADPLGFHCIQSENATGRSDPVAKQDAAFDAERAGPEILFQAMKDLVQREAALLFLATTSDKPGADTRRALNIETQEQVNALWISSKRALARDLGADVSNTQLTSLFTHLIETRPQAVDVLLTRAAHDLTSGDSKGSLRNGAGRPVRLGTSETETLAGLKGSSLFYCGQKFAESGELNWAPRGVCEEVGGDVSIPCAACVQLLADTGRVRFCGTSSPNPAPSAEAATPTFLLSDLVVDLCIKTLSKANEALAVQLSFALFASCMQVAHVGQCQAEWAATQLSRLVHAHKDALSSPVWAPFKLAANAILPRLLTAVEAGESKVVPSNALMHSQFLQSLIEVAVLSNVPWLQSNGAPRPVMQLFERLSSPQPTSRLSREMQAKLLELAGSSAKAEAAVTIGGRPVVGDMVMLTSDYAEYDDAAGGPLTPGDVAELIADDDSQKPFQVSFKGRQWWYRSAALQKAVPAAVSAPSRSAAIPDGTLPEGFEALAHLPAEELRRRVEDIQCISAALASGAYTQLSICTAGSLCHDLLLRRKHELLLPGMNKTLLEKAISKTNNSGSHGPEIELNRMAYFAAEHKFTLFAQACVQLLPHIRGDTPECLRCARAWKVVFVGEGTSRY